MIIIMSVLLAVGCGQKDRMKIESKPKDIKNSTTSQGQSERPEYAIKAPDFTLRTVQGDVFNLSDYKGKVILLNFWGTWCGPCRREIPDFNKLHDKYKLDAVTIAGGCGMNSVANGKVSLRTPFKNIYIQAAAGDAGGSLGAALAYWHLSLIHI